MNRRGFLTTAALASGISGVGGVSGLAEDKNAASALGPSRADFIHPRILESGNLPANAQVLENPGRRGPVVLDAGSSPKGANQERRTQFVLVEVNRDSSGDTFIDPYLAQPALKGSDDKPDAALQIELQGFHLDERETVDRKTRATMRVTTTNGTGLTTAGDALFWAMTTGFDLYRQSRKPGELKGKTPDTLGSNNSSRPIEMPNGLGSFQIEIIKHKEPSWWRQVFSKLASSDSDLITESIGFPAITKPALRLLDEFLTKLDDSQAKPLITSDFMPYAFSARGKAKYEVPGQKIGVLNPGTWILVKLEDFGVLRDQRPYYYGSFGRLIPHDQEPIQFLAAATKNPAQDPFRQMTYAVFKASLAEHKFTAAL